MHIPRILTYLTSPQVTKPTQYTEFHGVSGLLFKRYNQLLPELRHELKCEFIKYWKRNLTKMDILTALSSSDEIPSQVVLLKGAALLEDIYPELGSRTMCDIDLLVDAKELNQCDMWLLKNGFLKKDIKSWKGDEFKFIYSKLTNDSDEVIIEVHTRLFWHTDQKLGLDLKETQFTGFKKLSLEENIIYLIGHLGFQHTLTKLNWFFDLYYIFEKYQDDIDWKQIEHLAVELNLKTSLSVVVYILNEYFFETYQAPSPFKLSLYIQKKLTLDFLWADPKPKFNYYVLKHYLKDSWLRAFKYDLFWGLNKVKTIFGL